MENQKYDHRKKEFRYNKNTFEKLCYYRSLSNDLIEKEDQLYNEVRNWRTMANGYITIMNRPLNPQARKLPWLEAITFHLN